jgi:hypothetical protein
MSTKDLRVEHWLNENDVIAPGGKFGTSVNYSEFEDDGTLVFKGDATVWDDLRFPATRIRQGATLKPDFDTTNIGLLFPQNDATEIAYIIAQMPHSWKLGSTIYPHIHWVQDGATVPTFKMDYRWYNNGADPTGSFTTVTFDTELYSYTSGSILQITYIDGGISGSGKTLSSLLDIKLYREDNDYVGDALMKEMDIHFEMDTVGSREETAK